MQLILFAAAFAAAPVIYEGDATAAVMAVSGATGVPPWELRPLAVGELFPGEGALAVGAAQPADCGGGPKTTNAAVRDLVAAAEKRLNKQEWGEMRERLAAAAAALPCLNEPAEASLAARLFFLDGFAAGETGDVAASRVAFRRTLAFQPTFVWDEGRFVGAARTTWDAVRAAPAPEGLLVLGPGFEAEATLWVDGRLATPQKGVLSLAEGVHLVQLLQPSVSTWAVATRPGSPAALVRAAEARKWALSAVGTENGRAILEAAAERALGVDGEAWVWNGDALWHTTTAWESVLVKRVPAPPPPGRAKLASGMVGAGAALLGAGGLVAAVTLSEAATLKPKVTGESPETYEMRNDWFHSSSALGVASAVTAGVGAIGLVTGLILMPPPPGVASLTVTPQVGGASLVMSGGF